MHPEAPAIIEGDQILTYAELDSLIDSIMAKFYDMKPDYVGIVMHHGAEQIAAARHSIINKTYYKRRRCYKML